MKDKKFYVLLIGLIFIGLGSVFLYRQQEEQRVLEFEGYEISTIEDQVEALFNDEKTDIAQGLSEEELEDLEVIFEELNEKKLNRRSRDQIQEMELDFLMARDMLSTEEEVKEVFVEANVVKSEVSEEDINGLEFDVLTFEEMVDYVDRNIELLAYARQQVLAIDEAAEFVESLFDEEANVLETVTLEDVEEARELLAAIRNDEIKEELLAQIETVHLVLTEREEQLALEETQEAEAFEADVQFESEESEEVEGGTEETQVTAPPAQSWTPAQTVNSGTSESTGGSSSRGTADNDTGNKTAAPEPGPARPSEDNGNDTESPSDTDDPDRNNGADTPSDEENTESAEEAGTEEEGSDGPQNDKTADQADDADAADDAADTDDTEE